MDQVCGKFTRPKDNIMTQSIIKSTTYVTSKNNSLEGFIDNPNDKGKSCVIVDSSGSMCETVGNISKWDHLIHALQSNFANSDNPCISFSSTAYFTDINNPYNQGGGTSLSIALNLYEKECLSKNPGINHLIIISDGETIDSQACKGIGKMLSLRGVTADCIFIGNDGDMGAIFMKELAEIMGGSQTTVNDEKDEIKLLKNVIKGYLPEKTIQL